MSKLNLEHVLDDPKTCSSLRVLFAWCLLSMGVEPSSRFRLKDGIYADVTRDQLAALPNAQWISETTDIQ